MTDFAGVCKRPKKFLSAFRAKRPSGSRRKQRKYDGSPYWWTLAGMERRAKNARKRKSREDRTPFGHAQGCRGAMPAHIRAA